MNAKEWAAKLNGREYTEEITVAEEAGARSDNVLIVFGQSDDLMEFRGAIDDETGAWEGQTVKITPEGVLFSEEENNETHEWNRVQISCMPKIMAIWCPKGEDGKEYASWLIDSKVPHESFDIMEDGKLYCRGAVFAMADLEAWG